MAFDGFPAPVLPQGHERRPDTGAAMVGHFAEAHVAHRAQMVEVVQHMLARRRRVKADLIGPVARWGRQRRCGTEATGLPALHEGSESGL